MVHWGDSFWGEANRSFEILSSNVKNGAIAIEEFQRFLNESSQCESTYCKSLSRLQSQLLKTQHVGTFTPIWSSIRDLLDKISSAHLTTVNFYQELLRDIHTYQELYHKKFKTHIQKDSDITRTTDIISQLNNSLNTVNKAKEQYHSINLDYERAKGAGNNLIATSSTSITQDNNSTSLAQAAMNTLTSRQIERLEKKNRQSQDDYKGSIEKYNSVRNEYEKRFYDACTKFQDFEIDHIEKMLVFSLNYSEVLQRKNEQIRIAQNEFNEKLKSFTGNDLLETFVEQKKTGTDRPLALQFEEFDNLKASTQLTNSTVADLLTSHDDLSPFEQFETGVPSFQAHFSVSPPSMKNNDRNNRAFSPVSSHHPQSSSNNTVMSSLSSPVSPITSNNITTRSQETGNNNDQAFNPFDVIIKRTKFPGFFGSNRKDKKGKKTEKKPSINSKSNKTPPVQQQRDGSSSAHVQNSSFSTDYYGESIEDPNQTVANINKNKCPTPEPYIKSSLLASTDNTNRHNSQSTIPFSSKASESSSSSDTSEDDVMLKIDFKIKPKSQITSQTTIEEEGDDETKISNAMRLIAQNIGNFSVNSRGSSNNTGDMNKSVSSGQVGKRIPPPLPSRPSTTVPNSIAADNFDQSSAFPLHDPFKQSSKLSDIASNNQESFFIQRRSTTPSTENKKATSISSTEDDTEVANSFPNDNSLNQTIPFPILKPPPSHQSTNSFSPSITSNNQNSNDSPITFIDQGISPLTIGAAEQIPLAIAFQETIHVMMSGTNQENWKSRIVGEMLISFPASIFNLLADSPHFGNTLEFRLKNLNNIENITLKSPSITQNESDELIYTFNKSELNNILRSLQEKNSSLRFFNLSVLNYEVKLPDVSKIPIEVSSQWTRTFDTISVNISYSFNSSTLPDSIRLNNNTVIIYTIITDGQQIKESLPMAEWSLNEHKLWWKVPYIRNGKGTLTATMMASQVNSGENDSDQHQPLSTSSIINVYFLGENALFSSVDFDLACRGYRISLLKKKILSGKYQSEPDQNEPIHLFQRPSHDQPRSTTSPAPLAQLNSSAM